MHGHCHQKALVGTGFDEDMLQRSGARVTTLDSGCCGMAGAFGFEKTHYDVSVRCGERVLLPAVRGASTETLIIADGFSCREQIAQLTDRHPLHLAQVLQMAMREGAAT
jgi:Fe-S oxidoreductase